MNGDLLTDLDFRRLVAFHRSRKAALTVASYWRNVKVDFGVLRANEHGHVIGFDEKPRIGYLVSMGVYVLNERVLGLIPQGELFGFDQLVQALLGVGERVVSFRHHGYWLDIGRPDDYERAVAEFEEVRSRLLPENRSEP